MTLSRFPGVSFPPNFTAEIPTAIPFSPQGMFTLGVFFDEKVDECQIKSWQRFGYK